ncbi:MAG: hypothetical protein IH931_05525, partial [candidate division Zixibacteria bacterium]|nr:hypothetical protein [candidate division Zixibacteria bacterium]
MAEHWVYIASLGIFLVFVDFLISWHKQLKLKNVGRLISIFPIAFCLIFYSKQTMAQNRTWKDEITLYKYILEYTPISLRVNLRLVQAYTLNGNLKEAKKIYHELIVLNPRSEIATHMLATIYEKEGDLKRAEEFFKKYLAVNPQSSK